MRKGLVAGVAVVVALAITVVACFSEDYVPCDYDAASLLVHIPSTQPNNAECAGSIALVCEGGSPSLELLSPVGCDTRVGGYGHIGFAETCTLTVRCADGATETANVSFAPGSDSCPVPAPARIVACGVEPDAGADAADGD